MGVQVDEIKWILYKHINDFEQIKEVAVYVKEQSGYMSNNARYQMRDTLAAMQLYHTRHPRTRPLDTMHHRIRTLEYFMFGYDTVVDGNRKFIFSPLGNLFLKNINDEEKLSKIFATMLFALQFQHPCNHSAPEIQLYPFRLLFKLMQDSRLDYKLHFSEYVHCIGKLQSISYEEYELLVDDILSFRELDPDDQLRILKEDEHYSVVSLYEWQYYVSKVLESAGIITRVEEGEIGRLYHPRQPWSKKETKPTGRKLDGGYVTINDNVYSFIASMLEEYSFADEPVIFKDSNELIIDSIKEIYSFYPRLLSEALGEEDEIQAKLLELPQLIEKYSNNPDGKTTDLFEDVLEDGFNMFYDVQARKYSGAGHTDIECKYTTRNKKFAVEAKSTQNKLLLVNSNRLKEHRKQINGEYTILITSRYVPAVKRDIRGENIVILLAHTFSEYLYNHIYHNEREIPYQDFDDIIINHQGEDISQLVSDLTINKFAVTSK